MPSQAGSCLRRALLALTLLTGCLPAARSPEPLRAQARDPQPALRGSPRVEKLLAGLTLEEKLGQLTQRRGGTSSKNLNSLLDDAELERVRAGRVGSYLHLGGAATVRALQRVAVEQSRARIPLLFAGDIVHGYRTIFPVPLALACSWDPLAVERAARIAAVEASAAGLHWTFAPMVDIARDPRWGRMVEGAGEDPFLGAIMAAAQVRGFQGDDLRAPDTLLACPKHFAGYGAALGGRDYEGAELTPSTFHDVYLPPFRAAIEAGALSIMAAFNEIGGLPATGSRSLLTERLRTSWGFRGLVVSDWNAVDELRRHGVAASAGDAAALALEAGTDVEMTSELYETELLARVRSGALSEATIDQAVRRVLHVKEALGLLDDPYRAVAPEREAEVTLTREHVQAARELAGKSIVLLRNDAGVLPLSKHLRRLAVVGPYAGDSFSPLGSWRGVGRATDVVSLVDGIRAALPEAELLHAPGCEVDPRSVAIMEGGKRASAAFDMTQVEVKRESETLDGLAAALRAARAAEATVLVVGEHGDDSGEARSRASLALSPCQRALAVALYALGKPVVTLLSTGRPLVLHELSDAKTLLLGFHLGLQSGHALADVLFGDVSPGGKLPVTWPRLEGQVPIFYAHRASGRPAEATLAHDTTRYRDLPPNPAFPFGHGLSYTAFAYDALELETPTVPMEGALRLRFRLRNTGPRSGDEVVQIYVRDRVASRSRPVQELRGFLRVSLASGESVVVEASLDAEQLGFTREDARYVVEPGEFDLSIGSSSADAALRGSFSLVGESRTATLAPVLTNRVRVAR